MSEENNLTECMCEYCGQVVQADEEIMYLAKQEPRVAAKLVCDCKEAQSFQWRFDVLNRGIEMVDAVCGKDSKEPLDMEIVKMLHRAVNQIVKRNIISITIGVSSREKVTLKLGRKGIKCNREQKESNAEEIAF